MPSRRALSLLPVLVMGLALACQLPGLPKSADAKYQDARAAVGSAISYRLAVSYRLNGFDRSYSFAIAKNGDLSGTLSLQGASVDIIKSSGHTFIRGQAFIAQFGNPTLAAQVGDRWVRTDINPLGSVTSLGPDTLAQTIASGSSLQEAGGDSIGGVSVTKLSNRNGVIYIASKGAPYILRVVTAAGAQPGGISNLDALYTDYDRAKPDPPPASFVDTAAH